MPFLPEIQLTAIASEEPTKQIESIVRQLNEWARTISNERRADVYKDNSNTNRIIIGVLPDGETGIVISKEGVDVQTVFD